MNFTTLDYWNKLPLEQRQYVYDVLAEIAGASAMDFSLQSEKLKKIDYEKWPEELKIKLIKADVFRTALAILHEIVDNQNTNEGCSDGSSRS